MKSKAYTTSLQLPFHFDEPRLLADLQQALQSQWVPHFNKGGYEGEWNSIALYAEAGNAQNIFALPQSGQAPIETPLLQHCPYFKEVIDHFKCEFLSVRLLRLAAGAYIKPHRDFELGYEDGSFRLHIPITTNTDVSFILDGEKIGMSPGECWYTNVNYIHSVENQGNTDRIHLIIDGKRNEWSDQLFFALAPEETFFPPKEEKLTRETLEKILQELKMNPKSQNEELIKELEQKKQALEREDSQPIRRRSSSFQPKK